jgi:hypothetical protein
MGWHGHSFTVFWGKNRKKGKIKFFSLAVSLQPVQKKQNGLQH